jgi:hypothetical protein
MSVPIEVRERERQEGRVHLACEVSHRSMATTR